MKQQVIFLNGGAPKENFLDYYDCIEKISFNPQESDFENWNKTLGKYLGEEYEYIKIPLPSKEFADFRAWKIMFEKLFPLLRKEPIFIATSLGASFLLKYIGQYEFPYQIKKLFLLAPALRDTPQEILGSFSFDIEKIYYRVSRWTKKVYIYHSHDDIFVPFSHSLELKNYFPDAIFREFYDKGHFYLEKELPELIEDIKVLI